MSKQEEKEIRQAWAFWGRLSDIYTGDKAIIYWERSRFYRSLLVAAGKIS